MHKKHLFLGSALLLSALLAGGYAYVPSEESLKISFEQQASTLLKMPVTSQSAKLIYFPHPHLQIDGLTVANHLNFDKITFKIGFLGLFQHDLSQKPLHLKLQSTAFQHKYTSHIVIENPIAWKQGLESNIEIAVEAQGLHTALTGKIQNSNAQLMAKELWLRGYFFKDARVTISPYSVTVNDAKGYKGTFSGQMKVLNKVTHVEFQAKSVDMLTFLPHTNITGLAHIDAMALFTTQGNLPTDAKINLSMATGVYHKGNIDETIKDVVRRPLARSNIPLKTGHTAFSSLQSSLVWQDTKLKGYNLVLITANSQTHMNGANDWNRRNLNVKGLATLNKETIELPFIVQGSFQEPQLRFDVQQLIQQSKATAPLRSPARDEDAAKAVLDVISRTSPNLAAPDELMKNISNRN